MDYFDKEDITMSDGEPMVDRFEEVFSKYRSKIDVEKVKTVVEWAKREASGETDIKILTKLFSCVDLTTLKAVDNDDTVLALVEKVNSFEEVYSELQPVASICVYPRYASIVSNSLDDDRVKTCCVAGGFPSAQTFPEIKIAEASLALHDGADEIDVVQNPGYILNGDYETLSDEINEIKEVCGDKTLKVIIETGALGSAENVKRASLIALYSGADFIKTSTGKEVAGADPESFCIMCQTIKEYAGETGGIVGIKAAGGISDYKKAMVYWYIVKHILGEEWLNNQRFRIGASSLANNLLSKIIGKECRHF